MQVNKASISPPSKLKMSIIYYFAGIRRLHSALSPFRLGPQSFTQYPAAVPIPHPTLSPRDKKSTVIDYII